MGAPLSRCGKNRQRTVRPNEFFQPVRDGTNKAQTQSSQCYGSNCVQLLQEFCRECACLPSSFLRRHPPTIRCDRCQCFQDLLDARRSLAFAGFLFSSALATFGSCCSVTDILSCFLQRSICWLCLPAALPGNLYCDDTLFA